MLQLDRHRPSPGVPEFNRRFVWVVAFIGTAFLVLIGRLWQLQVVRGQAYFDRTTNNFVKERWIEAVRGKITDRDGVVLVDNRPAFNLYVTPRYFTPEAEERLIRVMKLAPDQATQLREKVARAREKDRYRALLLFEDITRDQLAVVKQAERSLPGVEVQDVPHRAYLSGTLAAHVLGYMNQINEQELEEKRDDGYLEGDYVGRYGIEKKSEDFLRGKKGVERYVVDARGVRQPDSEADELIQGERFVRPIPGHDVVLTIDVELQRIAERALRNHPAGGIAVVDVRTGRILSLVSKPAFDPNVMTGHLTRAEEALLEADPYKPFLDKTLRQHYFPGSTYKFVTAIASLEDGADPSAKVLCKGWHELGKRTFRCTKAHGLVDLHDAMAQSCNVYFWVHAEKEGIDRLAKVARDFGFGAPTGLGINGDVPGRVPWKAWYENQGGFRIGYTLNTATGQGDTEVTVVQLAMAYAAIANGGSLWVPQIIEKIVAASGRLVKDFPPNLRRKIDVRPETLEAVRSGLWGTVNDPKGTAHASMMPDLGVAVAGKTGTAQVRKLYRGDASAIAREDRDHAWFAGYAPADVPEISIVVIVEHGGKGGGVAAPIAMEIIKGYEDLKHGIHAAEPAEGEVP